MDQTEDERSPTEDARPFLPTEIVRPGPPGQAEQATQAGPAYQPTHADRASRPPAPAGPTYTPTHAQTAGPPAEAGAPPGYLAPADQPTQDGRAEPAREYQRYGPGVPAAAPSGPASETAERIWRTGRPDQPARRPRRWRGLIGTALTVILLAASAVVLYLRFHHAPFHVTGVAITQRTQTTCGVDVTGQISTNGAAGTVSYQWLFQPDRRSPQPLSQSVVAGQDVVYVTVAVQGSGHGNASRTVTLQILGPDRRATSTKVILQC